MDMEEIKRRQMKEGEALVAQGGEPDSVMLLSPEEYAQTLPRGIDGRDMELFDLNKGTSDGFPISQIGVKEVLASCDFGDYSFQRLGYSHPAYVYLSATLKTLAQADGEDLTKQQIEDQKGIYGTLFEILDNEIVNLTEELDYEKAALDKTRLHYLDTFERESDIRALERVVSAVRQMKDKCQTGIDRLFAIEQEMKAARGE